MVLGGGRVISIPRNLSKSTNIPPSLYLVSIDPSFYSPSDRTRAKAAKVNTHIHLELRKWLEISMQRLQEYPQKRSPIICSPAVINEEIIGE